MRSLDAWLATGLLFLGACKSATSDQGAAPKPSASAPVASHTSNSPTKSSAATARPHLPPPPKPQDEPPEHPDSAKARFNVAPPVNVGPSGPASASVRGVVMVDVEGRVHLAPLGPPRPGTTPIQPLDAKGLRFYRYGFGPAIVGESVFFVHAGKLRRLDAKGEAVLASDAQSGSRLAATAVPKQDGRVAVAYIAQTGGDPQARLWVGTEHPMTLSPEGSAASSVALVTEKNRVLALAIEGRSGMSPVHARHVTWDRTGPHLGEDVVVWVGGPAQPLTEVAGLAAPDRAWAFVAIEQDTTHFGLARIHLGQSLQTASPVSWRLYPNGLDPALVTPVQLCGEPAVLYTRPAEATPGAPQELHLSTVAPRGLSASQKVAFAGRFTNVSAASLPSGALVVYVGDGRTWAVALECPR